MRREIAQCLGVDISRVTDDANFFLDLGGTPQHLRPLRLKIADALGVSVEPVIDEINALAEIDGKGNVTFPALMRLRSYLSGWPGPRQPTPFANLFTVSLIEAIVAKALDEKAVEEKAKPVTLAPEHAAKIRELIALRARVSVDTLLPQTNLVRELGINGESLGLLVAMLDSEFDIKVMSALHQVKTRCQVDAEGRLTPSAVKHLRLLLPGLELDATRPTSFDDLMTVAGLEALVAKLIADRPPDLPFEPIWSAKQQEWVRTLPEELGLRKLRLLLVGGCRLAFEPRKARLEREVLDAFEAIERFADTGKTKAALLGFQKTFREWAGSRNPQYAALYDVLDPTAIIEPMNAVANAIRHCRELSPTYAMREILRLHRDLVSPLADPQEFSAAWRTPAVVEIARSLYESRDFREMPRLADALEQAGCTNKAVLEHCRDPNALHIRGCWVIDAVLDGSWATPPKAPKKKKEPKNRLVAQLSKRDQYQLQELSKHPDSLIPIEEFYAKQWDHPEHAATREQMVTGWSRMLPKLTDEQLRIAVRFGWIGHFDPAIRRILLEDPAEAARCGCLENRLAWLVNSLSPELGGPPDPLAAFAVNDLELARRAVEPRDDTEEESERIYRQTLAAVMQKDFDLARALLSKKEVRKLWRHRAWLQTCLQGIIENQPSQVAQGLQAQVDKERAARDKLNFGIIDFSAHGAYRLAREISPDLVAGFDVTQAFPWDAEFHTWTEQHPNPLEGLDLSRISPLLHDALVRLEPPEWWTRGMEGSPMDKCEIVLTSVGPKPKVVAHLVAIMNQIPEAQAEAMIQACPTVIIQGIIRARASQARHGLETEGATAEVRTM